VSYTQDPLYFLSKYIMLLSTSFSWGFCNLSSSPNIHAISSFTRLPSRDLWRYIHKRKWRRETVGEEQVDMFSSFIKKTESRNDLLLWPVTNPLQGCKNVVNIASVLWNEVHVTSRIVKTSALIKEEIIRRSNKFGQSPKENLRL